MFIKDESARISTRSIWCRMSMSRMLSIAVCCSCNVGNEENVIYFNSENVLNHFCCRSNDSVNFSRFQLQFSEIDLHSYTVLFCFKNQSVV